MSQPKITLRILPIRSGTLLTLAFFAAKIFGYINWDWKWVFSPLWVPTAIFFTVLVFLGLGAAIVLGSIFLWEAFFFNRKYRR